MRFLMIVLICLIIAAVPAWSEVTENSEESPAVREAPIPPARQLALPDISLIVQVKGKATDDERDPGRQEIELSEAELAVQGYVYPNVKADGFITMSPAEDEPAQVEEAYLTYIGLKKGLNLGIGKKRVSFGRTNLLHSHSWLYARQPLVITNFISPEGLIGQGANVSYLLPTGSDLFIQLDLGLWANGEEGEASELPQVMVGPGANLTDRFLTARLWIGHPVGEGGELELGASWASGKSEEDPEEEVDHVRLLGMDLSYRRFWEASRRLLLRGEYFRRRGTTDSDGKTAGGWYLFGDYRWSKYGSMGLLYDWSEFPQAVDMHESAFSVILTKQFSEQYYLRLQATRGSRPGAGRCSELWLHLAWGIGPHTHNLE